MKKQGGAFMNRWLIFLAVIFLLLFQFGAINSKSASLSTDEEGDQFSKDPKDLEGFINTVWILGYEVEHSLYTERLSMGLEVKTTKEGYVQLLVNTAGSELGYYDPGVLMVKVGASEDAERRYSVVIDNTDSGTLYTYEIEKIGNILKGTVLMRITKWGIEFGPGPLSGFKWNSPVCDKNNDDKLGMAEAIHYLKVAAGQ